MVWLEGKRFKIRVDRGYNRVLSVQGSGLAFHYFFVAAKKLKDCLFYLDKVQLLPT